MTDEPPDENAVLPFTLREVAKPRSAPSRSRRTRRDARIVLGSPSTSPPGCWRRSFCCCSG
jgi:hypothetical protein